MRIGYWHATVVVEAGNGNAIVSEMRFVDADSLALERRNSIVCNVVMMPAVGDFNVQQVISKAITLQAIWWITICIWILIGQDKRPRK